MSLDPMQAKVVVYFDYHGSDAPPEVESHPLFEDAEPGETFFHSTRAGEPRTVAEAYAMFQGCEQSGANDHFLTQLVSLAEGGHGFTIQADEGMYYVTDQDKGLVVTRDRIPEREYDTQVDMASVGDDGYAQVVGQHRVASTVMGEENGLHRHLLVNGKGEAVIVEASVAEQDTANLLPRVAAEGRIEDVADFLGESLVGATLAQLKSLGPDRPAPSP